MSAACPDGPPGSRAWPHSCLMLALLSAAAMALVPAPERGTLGWQWGQALQQPWSLWTAALFDASKSQWCANLALLMLLAVCGAGLGAQRRDALCLWLAWPLATQGLRWWPELNGLVGLSGVTHAAGAILIVRALDRHRGVALIALLALALKLGIEQGWATPRLFSPSWDSSVLYALHLSGALTGLALALLVRRGWRRAARSP